MTDPRTPPPLPLLPSPPLLRLPPAIRRLIYHFVGLASWDPGDPYRFDLHGRPAGHHGWGETIEMSVFHGLLLSCRALHAEAAALVYSANWFVLHYSRADPDSLRPLRALTTPSILSLSNLKVVLNQASCHQPSTSFGSCCLEGYHYLDSYGMFHYPHWKHHCKRSHRGSIHQLPLLSPAASGSGEEQELATARTILRDWHAAAAHLSMTDPGRLTLSLVCDINPKHPQALQIAESAVAPIRLLPPSHLKRCDVRLAKRPDGRLQQIARDTVLHACGIPTPSLEPSKRVTLTTLPRELRIRILQYTDLVTPRREVTWSRQEPQYAVFCRRFDARRDGIPSDRNDTRFFACSLRAWLSNGPPMNGCFCRRRHAAFTLDCECWAPPRPLFLICRALYEDAQFVFFSSNRFVIHDYSACLPWQVPLLDDHSEGPVPTYPYYSPRLAASQFLRDVVPTHSLAHLRFLELVFPCYRPPTWPESQHPAMQDWRATVSWLRGKINPSALTMRLVVLDTLYGDPSTYRSTITADGGDATMKAYMDLLEPLVPLAKEDGLARFFATLAYPWEFTEESQARCARSEDSGKAWLSGEKAAIKQRAERFVMGARYESLYANGREEPKLGDWHKVYYRFDYDHDDDGNGDDGGASSPEAGP
ncbi:uncharacterized protein B0H64DRAFT_364449 [Chaetomium fimeti]|uniref:F-box domain-containing protein n=1 Tax=Chaetomium fimeti TaxID=1854472 RepID=A0AAE0LQ33_9PEZI|nr:hypothetical protein B0H64DRAFT_364449 [Chaetomium fimeti]